MKLVYCLSIAALLIISGCSNSSSSGTVSADAVDPGDTRYNDASMKNFSKERPPLTVEPENPPAGGKVTIVVNVDGATTIKLTTGGESGCGDFPAETSGANPLTVTGNAGTSGYCDLAVEVDGTPDAYEGRFEVEATDPNIPSVSLTDGGWEEEDMPVAAGGLAITAVKGTTTIACGGTSTFTITYGGSSENAAGVFLRVNGYTDGHFYNYASGASGSATFDLSVASGCQAGPQTVYVVMVDELNNVSAEFPLNLTLQAASADKSAKLALAAAATCTVSGKATYEKFIVGATGRSRTGAMVPVRLATVKAIRASDGSTVLARGKTALDGAYSLSFPGNTDDNEYFVQVYATSDTLKQTVVNSKNATYAYKSSTIDCDSEVSKTGLNLQVKADNNSGAFNIWDVAVSANTYAKTSTGTAPPEVKILWNKGAQAKAGKSGSFYTTDNISNLPLIAMTGEKSDPDEWDDMVIGHEYGHFVMEQYSTDDSPGGEHNGRSLPTIALSEGWATFFAGACLGRSLYIDTDGDGAASVSYSFETPPKKTPLGTLDGDLDGATDEIAVNAVLWDLFDSTNETKDTLSGRSVEIWKILTVYLKKDYPKFVDRGYKGRDLIDFLDGWICLGYGDYGSADNKSGLRGAVIGLMQYPEEFIKESLASTCK
ncbi:MAG: hypothetical protein ACOYOS_16955 [Syntrophales bacterium]